MSHVASIEIEVKDLDCLAKACGELGIEFVRGQQTYRCWGTGKTREELDGFARRRGETVDQLMPKGFTIEEMGRCEHAIRLQGSTGCYEIGVVSRRDGRPGYMLLFDDHGKHPWEAKVGAKPMDRLKQCYAAEVAIKAAKKDGFRVARRTTRADGKIEIKLAR